MWMQRLALQIKAWVEVRAGRFSNFLGFLELQFAAVDIAPSRVSHYTSSRLQT
jgi:hypothetical protein